LSALAYVALAPVAVYASNGTVVLLVLAALGLGSLAPGLAHLQRMLSTIFGLGLASLVVWSFVTTTWAPTGWSAALTASRLTLVCLAGLLALAAIAQLGAAQRRVAQTALAVSGLAMLGFLALEIATDGALAAFLKRQHPGPGVMNSVGRGTTILALFVWPVCAVLATRAWGALLAGGVLSLAFALTVMLPTAASVLAFIVGLAVFAAVYFMRRAAIAAIFGLFALFTLAAPAIFLEIVTLDTAPALTSQLPDNWRHRLAIWRFTSARIAERPILGYGFDAARAIGREHVTAFLQTRVDTEPRPPVELMPLHPHNAPLQIWLELGLVGVACVLAMLFGAVRVIWRQADRPLFAASASASLASFLTLASISFGIWQNWWVATAWLAAGAFALSAPDQGHRLAEPEETRKP
jgi:O-antigen ligase